MAPLTLHADQSMQSIQFGTDYHKEHELELMIKFLRIPSLAINFDLLVFMSRSSEKLRL